jgi:hypothetical protein
MFIDRCGTFHDVAGVQSLVAAVGNLLGDKSIDNGAAGTDNLGNTMLRDLGRGEPLEVHIGIVTAVDSAGGAATVQFQLVMADNEALDSNLVVLAETAAIAEATLVAGYKARIGLVPPGTTKKFIGVRYVIAGEDVTVGTCIAALIPPGGSGDAVMA